MKARQPDKHESDTKSDQNKTPCENNNFAMDNAITHN